MKKFLTLTLVFVMVLGLAIPAMAFTSKVVEDTPDVPYEVDIYLVNAGEDDLGLMFSMPASNQGYAKNEIVCAIAKVVSPKNNMLYTDDGYQTVTLGSENVNLKVSDNNVRVGTRATLVAGGSGITASGIASWDYNEDGNLVRDIETDKTLLDLNAKFTAAWAFYGKVTDDDALMFIKVSKAKEFSGGTLDIGDFTVEKTSTVSGFKYTISEGTTDLFRVITGKNDKSTTMQVCFDSDWYEIYVDKDGNLGFAGINITAVEGTDKVEYTTFDSITSEEGKGAVKSRYRNLLTQYNDYVVDEFGFDFYLRGNVVNDDTFTGIANADDIYAEVVIEPWYAYVEVPPAIQVDPPKTGDAASILGFVMIALAGLAVVAVKKVRA